MMKRDVAKLLLCGLLLVGAGAPALAKSQMAALRPNVYFHFTDGHGSDFRVPQAVPTVTDCDPVKLAAVARLLQKQVPLYSKWTYVKAECRAPRH